MFAQCVQCLSGHLTGISEFGGLLDVADLFQCVRLTQACLWLGRLHFPAGRSAVWSRTHACALAMPAVIYSVTYLGRDRFVL